MKLQLLLALIISFSVLGESDLIGLNIKEADAQLKKQNWKPFPHQCEYEEEKEMYWLSNEAPSIFKAGLTSIHTCSGTGRNSCLFFYQKLSVVNRKINKECIAIKTIGEFAYKGLTSIIVAEVKNHCPEEC